jgi:ABC-type proline/glycine betaine transport system substrate-binding protein/voltage-gated potassium channel Kch
VLAAAGLVLAFVIAGAGPAPAEEGSAPRAVRMARATWDTGWFQAEVVRQLLMQLGYDVQPLRTMENAAFYEAVAAGEVDLWANGWFPLHEKYLDRPEVARAVARVGHEVREGALEGYLVDKRTAETLELDSLDDLRDREIAQVFDRDGDGRADLIGCNESWACAGSIEEHLDALQLRGSVEQIQGDYSPMMAETVERFRAGEPVLFYTWTPNWTVGELVPGRHVVWLEVPEKGTRGAALSEPGALVEDVPGCPSSPCRLGWPPNDIRVVAHRPFLEANPAIERLLSLIRIPIEEIHRQNVRMFRGEDDESDFRRHALDWIDRHGEEVDRWLNEARELRSGSGARAGPVLPYREEEQIAAGDVLRVATKRVEPFVTYHDRKYSGFSIELWEQIAGELDLDYELYGVNSLAKLLDDVERGAADLATAGIGITSERETELDFSHAYFKSGLQIMVRDPNPSLMASLFARIRSILFSRQLVYVTGLFLLMLLVSAHAVWLFERAHNPQFPRGYVRGIGEAFWWAAVTVTTVGYGDKTPRRSLGKAFALVWMFAGYFVFAYFTASVASSFTVRELQGTIAGPDDLFGREVVTVARSPAAEYLDRMGIRADELEGVEGAIERLTAGHAEAVVYDAPVLQHYASHDGRGRVHVVGPVFWEQHYGIALASDSPLRDPINRALLRLMERGEYRQIQQRWFGRTPGSGAD